MANRLQTSASALTAPSHPSPRRRHWAGSSWGCAGAHGPRRKERIAAGRTLSSSVRSPAGAIAVVQHPVALSPPLRSESSLFTKSARGRVGVPTRRHREPEAYVYEYGIIRVYIHNRPQVYMGAVYLYTCILVAFSGAVVNARVRGLGSNGTENRLKPLRRPGSLAAVARHGYTGRTETVVDSGTHEGGALGGGRPWGEDGPQAPSVPATGRPCPEVDRAGGTPRHGSAIAQRVTANALQGGARIGGDRQPPLVILSNVGGSR